MLGREGVTVPRGSSAIGRSVDIMMGAAVVVSLAGTLTLQSVHFERRYPRRRRGRGHRRRQHAGGRDCASRPAPALARASLASLVASWSVRLDCGLSLAKHVSSVSRAARRGASITLDGGRGRVSDRGVWRASAPPTGPRREILRAVGGCTGDAPRGQLARLIHVVDRPTLTSKPRRIARRSLNLLPGWMALAPSSVAPPRHSSDALDEPAECDGGGTSWKAAALVIEGKET